MHIPAHMLHGQICPVSLTVGAATIASAAYLYSKSKDTVSAARWAGVTGLIFSLQMLNFPVTHGTSGHLIGGVLAVSLLGIPRAILSIALVLFTQALLFADGGFDALGANIINMALITAGVGGLILILLKKQGLNKNISLGLASMTSVVLAALACSVEVAQGSVASFKTIAQAMIPVHLLIGVGEAVLTVALSLVLSKVMNIVEERRLMVRLALCSGAVLLLTPFASTLPDGLEWAAAQVSLTPQGTSFVGALFADYHVAAVHNPLLSTVLAGIIGILCVWGLSFGLSGKLNNRFQLGQK